MSAVAAAAKDLHSPGRASTLAPWVAGLLHGLFYAARGWREPHVAAGAPSALLIEGLVLCVVLPLLLALYQQLVREFLVGPLQRRGIGAGFYRDEPWTYAVVVLPSLAFPWNLMPGPAVTIGLFAALVLAQACVFGARLPAAQRAQVVTSQRYVALLFLISGFAALIYQVVWQRVLFTTFGVNSESVTVIVSVFMFGLGVGALAGGQLQRRYPEHLLRMFLALEIGIGLFGIASLELIRMAGDTGGTPSVPGLVLRTYALLAIPTLLMGATLPILVAYLQQRFRDIGKTVGVLYAFNTFGSAIAALMTVTVMFAVVGLAATVVVAALCNLVTAALIYHAGTKLSVVAAPRAEDHADASGERLGFGYALATLAAVGFITLSHEILWFRVLGYMTGSSPQVFGLLLAVVLAGIAAGALHAAYRLGAAATPSVHILKALTAAAVLFYLAVPFMANATMTVGTGVGVILGYLAAGAIAFLCGGVLPLLIHLAARSPGSSAASRVAWLYFANIVGATAGPLLTGFLLLDHFTLEENVALLSMLTLALVAALSFAAPGPRPARARLAGLAVLLAAGGWALHGHLYAGHLEKMQFATASDTPFKHKVEDRSGIIAVRDGGTDADVMYGNGAYDGRFNLDPVANSNLIDRAYMVAALHRQPRRVLEIGLSTGSWTRAISTYQPLESLTVVEIGRGYQQVIRHYPEIAGVLADPKVTVFLDDGRRWLRNHPGEKFDLIVMNTTFHWRSNMTNLLSREFLQLAKTHLNEGGVMYFNATLSEDVLHTAAHVFGHVTTYSTFVAASDAPFDATPAEKRANLLRFQTAAGTALFDGSPALRRKLDQMALQPLPDLRPGLLARTDLFLITDDNMAVEFKRR